MNSNFDLVSHSILNEIPERADLRDVNAVELEFRQAQDSFIKNEFDRAITLSDQVCSSVPKTYKIIDSNYRSFAKFSIIVVTYGDSNSFIPLIKSISNYIENDQFQFICVDNGNRYIYNYLRTHCSSFRLIVNGFNYGCSGGRNIGVAHASGDYIIFLDDDGTLAPLTLEHLISTAESTGAVTVRGKVIPSSKEGFSGDNYDKGPTIIPSIPDAEGISIWLRREFLRFNGFDPLLSGHEGIMLLSKMFKFHGPEAFLYNPNAVLYHDYAPSLIDKKQKIERMTRNDAYFRHRGINKRLLTNVFGSYSWNNQNRRLFSFTAKKLFVNSSRNKDQTKISILTTAKDELDNLYDYTLSLKHQTSSNFELIFVDDGSTDGTLDKIEHLWKGDNRLKIFESGGGRGAALNSALDRANEDICLIADADDISLPRRIEWTANYFAIKPQAGCVSFLLFNENQAYLAGLPLSYEPTSIMARLLLGMPAPFASFGFRQSEFSLPFRVDLKGGIDCDWINRNLRAGATDGALLPKHGVYYRRHDNQITAKHGNVQAQVACNWMYLTHESLLGELNDRDKRLARILSNWDRDPHRWKEFRNVEQYTIRLANAIEQRGGDCVKQELAVLRLRLFELEREYVHGDHASLSSQKAKNRYKYFQREYWFTKNQKFRNSVKKRAKWMRI